MSDLLPLKFQVLTSSVDLSFWHLLAQKKLDQYKLSEATIPLDASIKIGGSYSSQSEFELPSRVILTYESLPSEQNLEPRSQETHDKPFRFESFRVYGELFNTNTYQSFTSLKWNQILKDRSQRVWEQIQSGKWLEKPNKDSKGGLVEFFICSYSDLKKYKFYYWFSFPTILPPLKPFSALPPSQISDFWSSRIVTELCQEFHRLQLAIHKELYSESINNSHLLNSSNPISSSFFLIKLLSSSSSLSSIQLAPIWEWKSFWNLPENEVLDNSNHDYIVGFADPSEAPQHSGWPMRNLLFALSYTFGKQIKNITIVAYREKLIRSSTSSTSSTTSSTLEFPFDCSPSLVFSQVPLQCEISDIKEIPKCAGWEKDQNQKLAPRIVNLSSTMDPVSLSSSAVDLNLKLMRWRLWPSLQLENISNTKCLLLGAGTLGCNVARNLMGWGVRHITFVDNGKVSFSNPVRQSLFDFSDCLNGGSPKATTAASKLMSIFPEMKSSGYVISIPMPSHVVSPQEEKDVFEEVKILRELISEHDIIFLLTDTRESRWLPTLISCKLNKTVINAALGFDNFLVMRYGRSWKNESEKYGCYFCNDVVAPTNSTVDRTLDQQCTVTRPGLSFLASSYAVEIAISLIQSDNSLNGDEEIPHQMRGFLKGFQTLTLQSKAFPQCPACGPSVLEEYGKKGDEFLLNVFNDNRIEPEFPYLETISGLADMKKEDDRQNNHLIIQISDDEEDF